MGIVAWIEQLRTWDRFDASAAVGRLPRGLDRPLVGADVEGCCEIYQLNQPGRFPEGHFEDFKATLTLPRVLCLVAESQGRVIGVGGIVRSAGTWHTSSLCFGMIRPDWRRKGFGTALLLARLAALPKPRPREWVEITTVRDSATFYQRFGFRDRGRCLHLPTRHTFDSYAAILGKREWEACRRLLVESETKVDLAGLHLPGRRQTAAACHALGHSSVAKDPR